MGFIKAFTGALSQTFADQWKDYYVPKANVSSTAMVFEAEKKGTNNGVGENYKGSENIITNGSKIIVPENYALVTFQDGELTGCITDPGGYIFSSDDPNSKSLFVSGDGIIASTLKETWERFKFGGIPASQQLAFYVNMKEVIPGIHYGTDAVVQWNDSFFETKVGAMARGDMALHIQNPILFVKNFLPVNFLQPNAPTFDLNSDDPACEGLIKQFVNILSIGFTRLSMDAKAQGIDTYDYVSANRDKFAKVMAEEVETQFQWNSSYGLEVKNVTITMEYDDPTKELLLKIQEQDADIRMQRRRGELFGGGASGMMAAESAEALKYAAKNENGSIMGFAGMNMAQQAGSTMIGAVNNGQPAPAATEPVTNPEDPTQKLIQLKQLLDQGVITQEDFDAAKKKYLGI